MAWPDENKRAHGAPWCFWPGGLALALCMLAGCSPVSRGSLQSIRLAVQGERVHPTAESVAASSYYQLQVNTPDGEAVLILAKTEQGRLGWYGNHNDVVITRDGLVVKTVGLPQDLDDSAFPERDPFHEGLQRLTVPVDYPRRMDWSPGYRYGNVLQGHLAAGATEDVDILGTVRRLRRVDEHLSAPGIDMTNRYWIDPADGFIWKSRQHVAPGYAVETIQLRPYREGAP